MSSPSENQTVPSVADQQMMRGDQQPNAARNPQNQQQQAAMSGKINPPLMQQAMMMNPQMMQQMMATGQMSPQQWQQWQQQQQQMMHMQMMMQQQQAQQQRGWGNRTVGQGGQMGGLLMGGHRSTSSAQAMPPLSTQKSEIQTERSVNAVASKNTSTTCNSPAGTQTIPKVTPKTSISSQSAVNRTTKATPSNRLDSLVSNISSPSPQHNTIAIGTVASNTNQNVASPSLNANTNSAMGTAASTEATNKENVETPRRSGRERTSTLIYVDGHAIKKDNNYVLKGLSYEYGAAKGQERPPQPPQRRAPHNLNKAPRAPPVISQAELNRRKLKKEIAKRTQEKQPQRRHFLKQHVGRLKPFLEPKVLQQIQAFPSPQEDGMTEQQANTYQQPKAIKAEMRDYQLKGLNWMSDMYSKNLGFILGDEMGLGKTLQTISLVCHLKEQFGVTSGPTLIVCPLSVLYSWCNEIKKWSNLSFFRLHLSNTEKNDLPDLSSYDMVVTTYEMCKVPALNRLWSRQQFNLVVLDEGHRIKGIGSQQSQAMRKIHCENRVILTGTPLANNLVELYALLNFLAPDVFTTAEPFAKAYDLTHNVVDRDMLDKANKVLNLFMIRRLKTLVEKNMPRKVETKVICPLSNTQIWWYKALLLKDLSLLTGEKSKPAGALNNLIMQLRKATNHPFLLPFAEDHEEETKLEELIGESGKLAVLDMLLQSLYKKGHRVCLFSQFTSMLDILDDYARLRGWNFCRFDGGTARAERNYVVNSFNEPGSQRFLFLMSTRSGGMGLNLQTADTVILYDSDWNPQADIQAEARVHRIGQTKTVFVYRMVTANTVEERIAERAAKKMFMAAKIMKDGSADNSNQEAENEDAGQMMEALKFGCNAVFGDKEQQKMSLPTEDDIEMLTDRTRTEAFTGGNIKGGTDTNANDFDATKEFTSTTDFGGIDFKKLRQDFQKKRKPKDLGAICDIWRQKRQRKSRITLVEGKGSGYGSTTVPVLKSNDYDLETGERSVFQQELGGRKGNFKNVGSHHLKAGVDFESQDVCQVCGDGGDLLCCPRCPVSVHAECAQCTEKTFLCCSHHRCCECGKSTSDCGGFMFRCSTCPRGFCEDHLPAEANKLDRCERMEGLGYQIKNGIYVHCSPICQNVAVREFNFVPPDKQKKAPCPAAVDVSNFFGGTVDDCLDTPENLVVNTKRRRKQSTKYGDFETTETPKPAAASVSPAAALAPGAAVKPPTTNTGDVPSQANTISASSSGDSATSPLSVAASRSFESSYSSSDASESSDSDASVVVVKAPQRAVKKKEHPKAEAKAIVANPKPAGLLNKEKGEYSAFIAVVNGSLNLEIGTIPGSDAVVFLRYMNLKDGSKCLAEMRRAFRYKYDRVLGVNGICTRQSSLQEVLQIVQTFKHRGAKIIRLDMQEFPAWQREIAPRSVQLNA